MENGTAVPLPVSRPSRCAQQRAPQTRLIDDIDMIRTSEDGIGLTFMARYKRGETGWRGRLNEPIVVPQPETLKVFYPDIAEVERESYHLAVERELKMKQLIEERGLPTFRDVAYFLAEKFVPGFKVAGEGAKRRSSILGRQLQTYTEIEIIIKQRGWQNRRKRVEAVIEELAQVCPNRYGGSTKRARDRAMRMRRKDYYCGARLYRKSGN
jgi:hypothetical protein